jgi:hypothetical protein
MKCNLYPSRVGERKRERESKGESFHVTVQQTFAKLHEVTTFSLTCFFSSVNDDYVDDDIKVIVKHLVKEYEVIERVREEDYS